MDLPISFRAEIAVVKTFSSIIRNSHLRAQIAHPFEGHEPVWGMNFLVRLAASRLRLRTDDNGRH
jgi:hypothetical protein